MVFYKAKMTYSEKSIYKLTETQYSTFQSEKKLIIVSTAVAFIFIGFIRGISSVTGIVFLFAGSILLTGTNTRPRATAKIFVSQLKGKYPKFSYNFEDKEFYVYGEGSPTAYKSAVCLIEDTEYLYIYTNPDKAYMIEKTSVQGENGLDGLKSFVAQRSGLEWEHSFSLLGLNYKSLKKMLSRIKLRKNYYSGKS